MAQESKPENLPEIHACFWVATLGAPHGLKGHCVAYLETDRPEPYLSTKRFLYQPPKREILTRWVDVEALEPYKDDFRIKIRGVNSRELAERITGARLHLPLTELPPLSGKDFYYHEVIGFQLIDTTSGLQAEILDILEHPVHDLLEVRLSDMEKPGETAEEKPLIPIRDEWILEVNRKEKTLRMALPEGLLQVQENTPPGDLKQ